MSSEKLPSEVRLMITGICISWFFWGPADAYWAIYLKSFGSSYAQIGWLQSISKIIPLVLAVPIGLMDDKFSSRKLLLIALGAYMIIPLVFFYAGMMKIIVLLAATQLLLGGFQALRTISMKTYIKERLSPEQENKAWITYDLSTLSAWGLGLLAGGLIIAYFQPFELFLFAPIGVLIMMMIVYRLPPDEGEEQSTSTEKPYKRMLEGIKNLRNLDRQVINMLFVSFIAAATVGNMDIFMTLFAEQTGRGLAIIGLLMGAVYLSVLVATPVYRLSEKMGRYHSMAIGITLMILSLITVFIFHDISLTILFVSFLVHGIAWMFVRPVREGILAAFTPKNMQGEITGIQWSIFMLGNIVGAVAFGYIADIYGLKYVFVVTAAIYMFLLLLFIRGIFVHEHKVKHIKHKHVSHKRHRHHWIKN